MIPILILLVAYLLGAIPFGYVLVKWKTGADVRSAGSGNIGATNVLRTTGRAAGIATLLLDIAKGYLAVWMAGRFTAHDWLWMSAVALAVMAGHTYPVFLKFKGGKAVASFVGSFLCLTPVALAAAVVVFVGVVAWTRYISLGARGCAIWQDGCYAEADGYPTLVADTVGAGDGFAAALIFGLARRWKLGDIGALANRLGAIIAGSHGAIPDWNLTEVLAAIR